MSTPIVKPEVVFIEELLEEIKSGELRVPRFQRPFVWKPSDMLALFDSIYKGYPIGSLLFWQSAEAIESLDKVGPLDVPKAPTQSISYILDGHQRLATLLGALLLPQEASKGPQQQDWRWWIWFDLKEQEFIHVPKKEPETHLLPLRSVLKTVDFLKVAQALQDKFPDMASKFIEEAEQVAQKIKHYKVAIIRIQKGDINQAVEIFSILNKAGQQIKPDQMVSALTYREGKNAIHLAQQIDEILEQLSAYHFGNINRQIVFRAIIAVTQEKMTATDWAKLTLKLQEGNKNILQAAKDAKKALSRSAQFLREKLGVPSDNFLPYAYQFLLLSEFFHHCPKPNKSQIELLKKWFWVSSLSGWFSGAKPTQINNALEEMRHFAKTANKSITKWHFDDPVRPFPTYFDSRSGRVRALLIFMLTLKPLESTTGEPINEEVILQNRMFHVFTKVKQPHLSHPANRILLKKVPSQSVKKQLLSISENQLSRILHSHGIPLEGYEALQKNDAISFIEKRAEHLAQLERKFMENLGITPPKDEIFGETDIDTDD
ncbi:MAG: DUF262 domain-containing protein [Candidatus Parabeggiatoa sp.]|nr:DUF262 domain-containing protein [Candidatus Parabeggiatoa sp.]